MQTLKADFLANYDIKTVLECCTVCAHRNRPVFQRCFVPHRGCLLCRGV